MRNDCGGLLTLGLGRFSLRWISLISGPLEYKNLGHSIHFHASFSIIGPNRTRIMVRAAAPLKVHAWVMDAAIQSPSTPGLTPAPRHTTN
ncbi:MAG: hypothetical protein Q4G22_12355 [Paracoccus sp. (in: a-proteobacteria)]|uniref:hypothetical protein n=1 Tax=Paracoccus sp. TaxID=267 RepID=UPI0026DF1891|nr:hypothetical protein [Paracoccus sp. (in: a-proteobacteria)]MDO5632614.1 hypothetical protein [Paracoccus sp. (in: a-proteobacteria)]